MMSSKNGLLIVVSGPSGVGKGTVCQYLTEHEDNIFLSVSATSRKPRLGETEGIHYYFKTPERFEQMIENGELLEYARYITSSYGTPKKQCLEQLEKGNNVILEIEVQGGTKVKKNYPDTVMIFMVPPDMDVLMNRLSGRGTESAEVVNDRIRRAYEEFAYLEQYDYIVVNDSVSKTAERIKSIIVAESQKSSRTADIIRKELKI